MAGIYIHIPFCVKRCIYCDFYSNTCMELKDAYMDALLCEMEIKREEWQDEDFKTIYFGGGTPSLLHPHELKKILEGIYRHFSVSSHPEITLEGNPDDLSCHYLTSLTTLPINRISIGIQSFDDRELRLLNRRHSVREAIDAVMRCNEAGFTNISIDLIYGLPEQSIAGWTRTIDKAIDLDISHISAYNLTYEEGTAIYQMKRNKEINPVDDDECALLYDTLTTKLTGAGFVHYEISNFARRSARFPSGCISLHNSSYWNGTFYLGLGASAHSYNGTSRSWNVSSIREYISAMRDNTGSFYETERLDERARYNDFVLTRMRTMWGVSLGELRREFGEARESYFLGKAESFISIKKLKIQGDNVKVSPEYYFISDAIIRELIVL